MALKKNNLLKEFKELKQEALKELREEATISNDVKLLNKLKNYPI